MQPKDSNDETGDHTSVKSVVAAGVTTAQAPIDGSGMPVIAADKDLIEDEWVAIAKRIIAENKDNPYNLTKGISLLRADYMKKRYGKDIKLSD